MSKKGHWNLSPHTYQSYRVKGCNCSPEEVVSFIPLGQWCAENFYTKKQARTLMKKGKLLVTKCKNRIFVKPVNEE